MSRKITRFLSQSHTHENDVVINSSKAFLNDVHIFLKDSFLNDGQIFNTNHLWCSKEIHAGRTIAVSGFKKVKRVEQSLCATTHLYTIMPTISNYEKLLSAVFIVYPGRKMEFEIHVRRKMFEANNISTVDLKSGKVGSKNLKNISLKFIIKTY